MGNFCSGGSPVDSGGGGGKAVGKLSSKRDPGASLHANLLGQAKADELWKLFKKGKTLGAGITGEVIEAVRVDSNETYAIKSINLTRVDPAQLNELRNEVQILRTLDHPNIVQLYNVFEDAKNMYLVMEFMEGGELARRRLTRESQAVTVITQVLSAIRYCHERNVCHRDLKLENILFVGPDALEVKLIDFGLGASYQKQMKNGKKAGKRMLMTTCGTVYFMAPEVPRGAYTEKCDLWSIGVMTYMMLTGTPPFNGSSESEVMDKIKRKKPRYNQPVWGKVSPHAKEFVQNLLQKDAAQRWSADQALKSPWLKKFKDVGMNEKTRDNELEFDIVGNMKRFASFNRLQKAAMLAVAFDMSHAEIGKLREAFQAMDTDNTGYLTFHELQATLERYGGADSHGMDAGKIRQIFDQLDQDKTGQIRYLEFIAAALDLNLEKDGNRLKAAFKKLDIDGSGKITKDNLREVLGREYEPEMVEQMIAEADIKDTGDIDYEEFLAMFQRSMEGKNNAACGHSDAEATPAPADGPSAEDVSAATPSGVATSGVAVAVEK